MFCTQCGKRSDPAARYCFSCGHKLHQASASALDLGNRRASDVSHSKVAKTKPSGDLSTMEDASDTQSDAKEVNENYKGISGWLAYFVLGLIVSLGFSIYNSYSYLAGSSNYGGYSDRIIGLGMLFGALALLQAVALFLVFKSKHLAVPAVVTALILGILVYGVDAFMAQGIYKAANMQAPSDLFGGFERDIVLAPIWIIYFLRSKRVAATFTDRDYS